MNELQMYQIDVLNLEFCWNIREICHNFVYRNITR